MGNWQSLFDGALRFDPPPTDAQLAEIPAKRGVALLATGRDEPIVLLPAADMRSCVTARLQNPDEAERRLMPDLHAITAKVLWSPAGGHFETDLLYFERARAIWPKTFTKLLAWKPAWFVHVDPSAEFPRFSRTRDVLSAPGRYLGPFESGRSAQQFVEAVQDGFDLCRDHACLVRSPNARPCSYAQIGRCVSPCDGTISLADYRDLVARAADYAAGDRRPYTETLKQRMVEASKELRFEDAAAVKTRLERLAELDKPAYAQVRPAETLQYLLIQPSGSRKALHVFGVDRGAMTPRVEMNWPPEAKQPRDILKKISKFMAAERTIDEADRWRMGLAARYIYMTPAKRGVVLHWTDALDAETLLSAVDEAADVLRVRKRDVAADAPDKS